MTYKCINSLVQEYLSPKLESCKIKNKAYNTRSKDELRPPKCRNKNTERYFIFRACKLWNTLEEQVKQLKTRSQFKNAVKKRLHQKVLNVLTLNGTYFYFYST